MKAKRVVIVYNPNKLSSISSTEKVFHNIISDLKNNGEKFRILHNKRAIFESGTKVEKVPFGASLLGQRITHLYIDESVMDLDNGDKFVYEILLPCVIPYGNYINLDVDGDIKDRVFTFNHEGNIEKLEKQ